MFFYVFAICEEKLFIVLVFLLFFFVAFTKLDFLSLKFLCLKCSKYELHGFSHLWFDVKDVP